MPTYYHVTKKSKLKDIQIKGLLVSAGIAAGGMSADSSEASKYAQQDKGLIYLWTDVDHTGKFKVEKYKKDYALLVVNVDLNFFNEHIDVTTFSKAKAQTKTSPNLTTVVANATIPSQNLSYWKTQEDYENGILTPLSEYGKFSMSLDKGDYAIWGGEPP